MGVAPLTRHGLSPTEKNNNERETKAKVLSWVRSQVGVGKTFEREGTIIKNTQRVERDTQWRK